MPCRSDCPRQLNEDGRDALLQPVAIFLSAAQFANGEARLFRAFLQCHARMLERRIVDALPRVLQEEIEQVFRSDYADSLLSLGGEISDDPIDGALPLLFRKQAGIPVDLSHPLILLHIAGSLGRYWNLLQYMIGSVQR